MALFNTEKKIHIPENLVDKFIVNPFSVLRKTTGVWQDRKHYWVNLGIASNEGRDTRRYNAMPTNIGGAKYYNTEDTESISIFDPVLCELMYTWFSKKGERVLDPFAGGSVRGVVASFLGRYYTGIDLSQKQILANGDQVCKLQNEYPGKMSSIEWIVGDSEYALDDIPEHTFDMLFTCPPYYNLEQYTKDPRDLSRQDTYEAFLIKYTTIINKACSKLKPDSFAVIVVSEIRNPATGEYYGLVPDTIYAFRQAGLKYYNEIILEDSIGSLPLRGPKYFKQSRKIGRMHQNVLVFYKGDLSNIREKCDSYNISNNFGE